MTICRFSAPVLSAALMLGLAAHADAQPTPEKQLTLAIPAMPLGDALRQFARETGSNLAVDDRLVVGKMAPPLAGRFNPDEALHRLLAGTGLSARTIAGTIIISVPPGEVTLSGNSRNRDEEQEIVVTGTHVRGAPPTSPVITLTRKQIDQSGVTSVEDLMRRLPQNLSAGVAQENFAVLGAGADITQYGAGINLRGLGQRATLVLINGRRVAPSDNGSFVDVSLIPITAIERVEVVTDGASAIYGSDAVGGVVNFILRNDFKGVEPVVQVGTTTDGGGRQLLTGLTTGTTWARGHAMLSYEYRDDRPIKAGNRNFTINLPPDWDLTPGERRHSLYGTLHEELTSSLAFDVSGLFASRHTKRNFVDASQILIGGDAHAKSFGGTVAFLLKPGGSWHAEASANYFRTRTSERETQPEHLINLQNTLNEFKELSVKADGGLISLPGGTAKLALGVGLRREQYSSLFATTVNVPTPTVGARTITTAYGELNLPIFSDRNHISGVRQLTFTAAGRFEHYEHIGSTFNPKFGLLWSPLAGVSIRSSYGTSFRAPLLSESFGIYNVFLLPVAILYQDPTATNPGVGAVLVGDNRDVKPERSRSFTLGAEVVPPKIPKLKLSANYYRVDFTNRIALPSEEVNLIGNEAFAPVVTLNPAVSSVAGLMAGANQVLDFTGPNFTSGSATAGDVVAVVDGRISNTAETRTSGLDLLASYDFVFGGHQFRAELDANRVFYFDNKLTSASPWVRTLNTPFHPLGWRARAGLSWQRGALSALSFLNYSQAYRDNRTTVIVPVRSFTTVDTGLALDGSTTKIAWLKHLRIALNVRNLFDAKPPHLERDPNSRRGIGYDSVNASGEGRVVSFQLRSSW